MKKIKCDAKKWTALIGNGLRKCAAYRKLFMCAGAILLSWWPSETCVGAFNFQNESTEWKASIRRTANRIPTKDKMQPNGDRIYVLGFSCHLGRTLHSHKAPYNTRPHDNNECRFILSSACIVHGVSLFLGVEPWFACQYVVSDYWPGSGCCLGGCNKLTIFLFNLSAIEFLNLAIRFAAIRCRFTCSAYAQLLRSKNTIINFQSLHCTNYLTCKLSHNVLRESQRHDHLHTIDEKWYFMYSFFWLLLLICVHAFGIIKRFSLQHMPAPRPTHFDCLIVRIWC